MALFRTSLQVVAAFAIVIILFVIAYNLFSREATHAIQQSSQLRNHINVFKGVYDRAMITDGIEYNTVNSKGARFVNLKPSVNQASGIEFTYNFWLYKDLSTLTSPETAIDNGLTSGDMVLLLRGNNKVKEYSNVCGNNIRNVYVKCPLIKLQNKGDTLAVEFNTEESVDVVREGAKRVCGQTLNTWDEANQHKVAIRGLNGASFDKKWFMVTVIIQDTYPADPLPFRNRVRVRIYVNGILELDQYVNNANKLGTVSKDPTVLKPNNGNLYVMPKIQYVGDNNQTTNTYKPDNRNTVMMADLSYFNYVVDADAILSMYEAGFNNKYLVIEDSGNPLKTMSDRNDKGKAVKSTSEI